MRFELLLKKLDLADKEVGVYLACLELGAAPATQIARKARLLRPTTYLILESLMGRGLITRYRQNKKTLFLAESPRHLLHLIDDQEKELERRRKILKEALPALQGFMKKADDCPTVRYFEGLKGLRTIRQEMLRSSTHDDVWHSFDPMDYLLDVFGEQDYLYFRHRKAKGILARTIFTTRSETLKATLLATTNTHYAQRKFVSPELYTSASGMTVYRDCVAIGTFAGKLGGTIIESESIASLAREFFVLLWGTLEPRT